jgi:hypothetical protein
VPTKSTPLRPVSIGADPTAGSAGVVDLNAVKRFVRTVPSLRRLLALPALSDRELLLRAEMRQTIAKLAAALDEAARGEPGKIRAAVYRAAAAAAADLAAGPAALMAGPVTGDH